MYRAYGLLLPETNFSLEAAARKLKLKLPTFQVDHRDSCVVASREDWEIYMTVEEGEQVLAESQRISEHISGAVDELGISKCRQRVVVSSDIQDPQLEHFDDYLKVTEVLRSFDGLIAVDPQEPSLL